MIDGRHEKKALTAASLEYVYLMHVVQERKKFELVEALLEFMASWATYYKHGNSVCTASATYTNDLKSRVRKTRDNYEHTIEHYNSLKDKMMSGNQDPGLFNKMYTRQGYLYVQNSSNRKINNLIGQASWSKHFCQYQASSKTLTMIPYSQVWSLTYFVLTKGEVRANEKPQLLKEPFTYSIDTCHCH